jgi:hypothetical protein
MLAKGDFQLVLQLERNNTSIGGAAHADVASQESLRECVVQIPLLMLYSLLLSDLSPLTSLALLLRSLLSALREWRGGRFYVVGPDLEEHTLKLVINHKPSSPANASDPQPLPTEVEIFVGGQVLPSLPFYSFFIYCF